MIARRVIAPALAFLTVLPLCAALWVATSNCDGRGTCPEEKDVIVRIVGR